LSTNTLSGPEASLLRVEAARYAVLRRLAFAMRHELVKHLQPIGMVTQVIERRLRQAPPDFGQVLDSATKLNGFAKGAVQSCLDVITWLAPEPGATLPLAAAVDECTTLLRTNFSFRGLALTSSVGSLQQPVGRSAARMLLSGALLALSDATKGPAEIAIAATAGDEVIRVELGVRPTDGEALPGGELPYRPLQWAEIEAMAGTEDVEVQRTESGAVLTFIVLD
jgi:hypothetical protein